MDRLGRMALSVCAALLVAACSAPPYVYDSDEFNRNSADFGKDPTDIDNVTVCYNTRGATPATVVQLARDACGQFAKTAVFHEQTYDVCPASHPVAAVFDCEASETPAIGSFPLF